MSLLLDGEVILRLKSKVLSDKNCQRDKVNLVGFALNYVLIITEIEWRTNHRDKSEQIMRKSTKESKNETKGRTKKSTARRFYLMYFLNEYLIPVLCNPKMP